MGTNYYLVKEASHCEYCNRADELSSLHIGKSSGGWAFALRVYPDDGINSLDDWIKRWNSPKTIIRDSYSKQVSPAEMLDVILNRTGNSEQGRKPMSYADWDEFHQANYSYRGPHDLLFSTWKTVASEKTYQLFNHEFS